VKSSSESAFRRRLRFTLRAVGSNSCRFDLTHSKAFAQRLSLLALNSWEAVKRRKGKEWRKSEELLLLLCLFCADSSRGLLAETGHGPCDLQYRLVDVDVGPDNYPGTPDGSAPKVQGVHLIGGAGAGYDAQGCFQRYFRVDYLGVRESSDQVSHIALACAHRSTCFPTVRHYLCRGGTPIPPKLRCRAVRSPVGSRQ